MRLSLSAPYVLVEEDFIDAIDLPIEAIVSYVSRIGTRQGFLRTTVEGPLVALAANKMELNSRLYEVDFTQLFVPTGELHPAIVADFKDRSDLHILSRFKTIGRSLVVQFGVDVIETLINRLYVAYFPDRLLAAEEEGEAFGATVTFMTDYWALLLVHHVLVSTGLLYGSVKVQ